MVFAKWSGAKCRLVAGKDFVVPGNIGSSMDKNGWVFLYWEFDLACCRTYPGTEACKAPRNLAKTQKPETYPWCIEYPVGQTCPFGSICNNDRGR